MAGKLNWGRNLGVITSIIPCFNHSIQAASHTGLWMQLFFIPVLRYSHDSGFFFPTFMVSLSSCVGIQVLLCHHYWKYYSVLKTHYAHFVHWGQTGILLNVLGTKGWSLSGAQQAFHSLDISASFLHFFWNLLMGDKIEWRWRGTQP